MAVAAVAATMPPVVVENQRTLLQVSWCLWCEEFLPTESMHFTSCTAPCYQGGPPIPNSQLTFMDWSPCLCPLHGFVQVLLLLYVIALPHARMQRNMALDHGLRLGLSIDCRPYGLRPSMGVLGPWLNPSEMVAFQTFMRVIAAARNSTCQF